MLEELLIKIKSVLDGGGFTKAEVSMRNLGDVSKQQLGEAQAHAGSFGQGIVDTGSKMDQLKAKIKTLGPEMAAAGAAGVAAILYFYNTAIQAAAGSEQMWGRFAVSLGGTGFDIEAVKQKYSGLVDSIQNDTGRMRGDIVNSLADLARVGVTNENVLKSSSESMGALAFLTQRSFGDIEQGYVKLIGKSQIQERTLMSIGIRANTFNEVLKKNGLTMKDWASLTEEQRANLLNQAVAMQNGAAANETYKESYEGIMNMLNQQWKSFITEVGNALLPSLREMATVAIPILKGLLTAFKGLPGPVKDIIIILPLIVFGLMAIGGAYLMMAPVITAFKGLQLASKAAAAAQWLLNIAMSANPAVLIVIAVIALIAILIYLWTTNKQFRDGVIGIWNQIKASVINAVNYIENGWDGLVNYFTGLPGRIWKFLENIEKDLENFSTNSHNRAVAIGQNIWNGIVGSIVGIGTAVWNSLVGVVNSIVNIGGYAWTAAVVVGQNIWNGIMSGMWGGGAAGENADYGYVGSASGVTISSLVGLPGNSVTQIDAPITIGSIDSRETADYFAQQVAAHLSGVNDAKGR